jgi:cell division protein FtsQ
VFALVALVAVLIGGWLWVRDSSLVAVRRVRVAGANGPDAAQIRSALVTAARNMTTLDVQMGQLRTAVAPYPVVKRLAVQTQFPHGMTIHVTEQVPVAIVVAGGRRVAASGDGTLLRDVTPAASLPTVSLPVAPGGNHLSGSALGDVRLLAAAPYQLLAKISAVSNDSASGLVAQLRNGPSIYFGDSGHLGVKWSAAIAVLGDMRSAGASYIDVTDPSRPAAGTGSDAPTGASAPNPGAGSDAPTGASAPTAGGGSDAPMGGSAPAAGAAPTSTTTAADGASQG